jgi:ABC-2 type transport system permease protein
MKNFLFHLRLYFLLETVHLRTALTYRSDFWIGMLGVALTQGAGILFVWTIFQRIPVIEGWSLWEVALLYALVVIPRGLTELTSDGVWQLRALVNRGELDRLLVRPVNPLLQLVTQFASIHGLGGALLGSVVLIQSVSALHLNWGLGETLLLAFTLINAIILMSAINLLTNCIAFWDPSASSSFPFLIQQFCDFGKFPLTIYNRLMQFVLTWVVPFAFVSYYPGLVLLKRADASPWLAYGAPLSGPLVALVAIAVWRVGLSKYQGTGH